MLMVKGNELLHCRHQANMVVSDHADVVDEQQCLWIKLGQSLYC